MTWFGGGYRPEAAENQAGKGAAEVPRVKGIPEQMGDHAFRIIGGFAAFLFGLVMFAVTDLEESLQICLWVAIGGGGLWLSLAEGSEAAEKLTKELLKQGK